MDNLVQKLKNKKEKTANVVTTKGLANHMLKNNNKLLKRDPKQWDKKSNLEL